MGLVVPESCVLLLLKNHGPYRHRQDQKPLPLQKAMEAWNDAARNEVRPYARAGSIIRVPRQEVRRVVGVCVFEELAEDGRFVERLFVVLKCWYEAAGVEL